MDKFLELLLGEAYKHGVRKLFGYKPERSSDTSGSFGCLILLLMAILYPIGIYWLKPKLTAGSFWHENIYTWPLYIIGIWIAFYLFRFFLYCLKEMPIPTLLFAGLIWFAWYSIKKGWL